MGTQNTEQKSSNSILSCLGIIVLMIVLIISVPLGNHLKTQVLQLNFQSDYLNFLATCILSIGLVFALYLSFLFYRGKMDSYFSPTTPNAVAGGLLLDLTFVIIAVLFVPIAIIQKIFFKDTYKGITLKGNFILSLLLGIASASIFTFLLTLVIWVMKSAN